MKNFTICEATNYGPFTTERAVSDKNALTDREKNRIISAVNCRKTPEEAGLKTAEALQYYKVIWDDAQSLFDRGGAWPVFDLFELD